MPMIHAETVKAIGELLQERGIQQKKDERLGDYVARGLDISDAQAQTFLDALHDGNTVEEARTRAGISANIPRHDLLTDIARAVGSALARIRNLGG